MPLALDKALLWAEISDGVRLEDGRIVLDESCGFQGAEHETHVALWVRNKTGWLAQVEHIDLSKSTIQSIDEIRASTQLTALSLSGCQSLRSIAPLNGCTQLTELNLRGCTAPPTHLRRHYGSRAQVTALLETL